MRADLLIALVRLETFFSKQMFSLRLASSVKLSVSSAYFDQFAFL